MLDFESMVSSIDNNSEYEKRIGTLKQKGYQTDNIEDTVDECILNINNTCKSFVIYGEPQCGKTELMIALSAKLIDLGKKIIIVLLNDDTDLLNQNLQRFRESAVNPTPINYTDVLEENIGTRRWIIFCKKNAKDLFKLNNALDRIADKIIIDDEGDYASPNGKVNREEKTRINELIHKLIENNGVYIGVTATPARLDLNNTFLNLTEKWVQFRPHDNYVGKETFFPVNIHEELKFSLQKLPEHGDKPEYIRKAIASYIVNASLLNVKNDSTNHYAFLIHTSGEVNEHSKDKKDTVAYLDSLIDNKSKNHRRYWQEIIDIINGKGIDEINKKAVFQFAYTNISNQCVAVMNSKNKNNNLGVNTSTPPSIFSVFIGGNKVSRGITFGNLLGMFFTRDAQKIQQDTYIQRARMFGNRKRYLECFELWITESLYNDWRRCFMYHYLSLKSIQTNGSAPVWIGDDRIRPVSTQSIDKSTLVLDKGEMVFAKFAYSNVLEDIMTYTDKAKLLKDLQGLLGNDGFPKYVYDFIFSNTINPKRDISVLPTRFVGATKDDYEELLYRKRGTFGGNDLRPEAIHHLMITHNSKGEARLIYYYFGKVQFFRKSKKGDI